MQRIQVDNCIKSYIDNLKEQYKNAYEGKNPNCTRCDDIGDVEVKIVGRIYKSPCYCLENNKSSIEQKIFNYKKIYDDYFMRFGNLDDDLTLDRYAILFDRLDFIDLLKNYLSNGLPFSILLSGESGTGKTTILKIIYQILILNNISVCYFSCADFESYSRPYTLETLTINKELTK